MVAGADFVRALKAKFAEAGSEPTDRALALRLGMHHVHFSQMKGRDDLTAAQLANLVGRSDAASFERGRSDLIHTVVEFFPIDGDLNARGGKARELFETTVGGTSHPYRAGLRTELEGKRGVYLFYDSRGRALYAGKAKQQSLWKEMRSAFNRDRGEWQTLSRVDHPKKRTPFRRTNEKRRQILERRVPLSELAHYFSAYAIADDLIDSFEAFLIRAFANDLLNKQKANLSAPDTAAP